MNENQSKVIKCIRKVSGNRRNVAVNGELLEEVECFNYLGFKITVNGGIETKVKSMINDVVKVLGGMKVSNCRVMGIDIKRRDLIEVFKWVKDFNKEDINKVLIFKEKIKT